MKKSYRCLLMSLAFALPVVVAAAGANAATTAHLPHHAKHHVHVASAHVPHHHKAHHTVASLRTHPQA